MSRGIREMGTKTVKRLVILCVVGILVAGGGYFTWRFQVGRMARGVLGQVYQAAIEHKAPERLEAYQRRAVLLRSAALGRPAEADQVIEAMVRSDPGDYQVYLGRGRYRRRFGLPGAKEDFQEALRRQPK